MVRCYNISLLRDGWTLSRDKGHWRFVHKRARIVEFTKKEIDAETASRQLPIATHCKLTL
jgi:predicted RNA binding protein YcfA (HicA-like mRNA interferase family)